MTTKVSKSQKIDVICEVMGMEYLELLEEAVYDARFTLLTQKLQNEIESKPGFKKYMEEMQNKEMSIEEVETKKSPPNET